MSVMPASSTQGRTLLPAVTAASAAALTVATASAAASSALLLLRRGSGRRRLLGGGLRRLRRCRLLGRWLGRFGWLIFLRHSLASGGTSAAAKPSQSSELQSAFARRVGKRFHAAMIRSAAAIERDLVDAGGLGAVGARAARS